MAQDMYAPKSAFNIGYEQPLEAVEDRTEQISTDFQRMALRSEAKAINTEATVQRADFARREAMMNIFSSGISAFDSVLSATKAKRQDNLAKNFLSELDAIEQARESGEVSELKIQSMEGDLVRSALVSNLDFDKIKTEIELITDRPISMLGKSPEQYADSMMRNDPKYMIYTNASRLLNEGFSEKQHEEFAFDQIQMQQKNVAISDMAASRRKADEAITFNQFKAEDQPVIDDRFDTLVSSFIAGTERSSGIINREQVRSIKQAIQAEYTNLLSYKAVSGINSDDFQPFLDRVKGLEDTVDTILASTKADVYWEDFKAVIAANAANGGNPEDMLAAMATGDIPTLAQSMGAGNLSERLNDLVNSDAVKKYYEPISSGQTLTKIQSNSDGIVNPNSVLDIDSLPEEFVQETMIPGDRSGASNKEKTKANYNNGLEYLNETDINKLQEENFQKQFITGATNIIRALSTSDVASSKERISKAIVSTDMLNKLNRLESYNKTAADTIRIGVRSQLSHQRVVNSRYLDNIENDAGMLSGYRIKMTWDDSEKVYFINPADRPDQDKKSGIVAHVKELNPPYFRQNYVEGKGLRADPQQYNYFKGGVLEKARNARDSIEFIDKQFKLFEKSDVEVPEPISSVRDITPLGESRVNLLNNDEIFKVVSDALDAADTSANTGMLSDAAVKQEVAKLLGLTTKTTSTTDEEIDETTTDTTVDVDADEVQPTDEEIDETTTDTTVDVDADGVQPTDGKDFVDSFVTVMGKAEGTEDHTDSLGIKTLGYGILPATAKKYGFDPDSDKYKNNRQALAKDVYTKMNADAVKAYPKVFEGLTDSQKVGVLSMYINLGELSDGVVTALSKDTPDFDEAKTALAKVVLGSPRNEDETRKKDKDGNTIYTSSKGLSKRRAKEYNTLMSGQADFKPVATVSVEGTKAKPIFVWKDKDGNEIHRYEPSISGEDVVYQGLDKNSTMKTVSV